MRHLKSGRKLNRTAAHRKAMLGNLAVSILDHERVTTTVAKAKEVRGVVERLITYAKRGGLHNIRQAARTVKDKTVLKKLFDDLGPAYEKREGGYTRIVRVGERKGDHAPTAIIELVGRDGDEPRKRKKKASSSGRAGKRGASKEQPTGKAAEQTEPKAEEEAPVVESAEEAPAPDTKEPVEEKKEQGEEQSDLSQTTHGSDSGKDEESAESTTDKE